MITVIDYGMGNLRSVSKALESLGAKVRVTSDPQDVWAAEKLILRNEAPAVKKPLTRSTSYGWGDAEHLLESFARTAKLTLHVDVLSGSDFHHTCEAVFKGLGRALEMATRLNPRVKGVPSSKGRL